MSTLTSSRRFVSSRSSWLAAIVTLPTWLPLPADADSQFDGRYSGRITCDVIPGQTTEPLNTSIRLSE